MFETAAKWDSNPGSLDCESGILRSYRAPLAGGINVDTAYKTEKLAVTYYSGVRFILMLSIIILDEHATLQYMFEHRSSLETYVGLLLCSHPPILKQQLMKTLAA